MIPVQGNRIPLLKFQLTPGLIQLMSSGSKKKKKKKKKPRYACLSEARASHSQRVWAEV
jgi:hypothetical protein